MEDEEEAVSLRYKQMLNSMEELSSNFYGFVFSWHYLKNVELIKNFPQR